MKRLESETDGPMVSAARGIGDGLGQPAATSGQDQRVPRAPYIPLSVREAGGLVQQLWERGLLDYEGGQEVAAMQVDRLEYAKRLKYAVELLERIEREAAWIGSRELESAIEDFTDMMREDGWV